MIASSSASWAPVSAAVDSLHFLALVSGSGDLVAMAPLALAPGAFRFRYSPFPRRDWLLAARESCFFFPAGRGVAG